MITDTYPFKGAAVCYRRARKLLDWMGTNGYVQQHKRGKHRYCTVDPEMNRLIDAMNKGDEETIKAFLIHPDYFNIVHEDN